MTGSRRTFCRDQRFPFKFLLVLPLMIPVVSGNITIRFEQITGPKFLDRRTRSAHAQTDLLCGSLQKCHPVRRNELIQLQRIQFHRSSKRLSPEERVVASLAFVEPALASPSFSYPSSAAFSAHGVWITLLCYLFYHNRKIL